MDEKTKLAVEKVLDLTLRGLNARYPNGHCVPGVDSRYVGRLLSDADLAAAVLGRKVWLGVAGWHAVPIPEFPELVIPARLDREGTARPLTKLVSHVPVDGRCVDVGALHVEPALEVVETGARTRLHPDCHGEWPHHHGADETCPRCRPDNQG